MLNNIISTLSNLSNIDMTVFTNCTVDYKCGNVQMIEYLYNSIVSCLVDSACNSVPKTRCNFSDFVGTRI